MTMNCHDTRFLLGSYLDSELDVKTSQGIRDHLVSCPECASLFEAEDRFQRRLQAALRHGDRTPALWQAVADRTASVFAPGGSESGGAGRSLATAGRGGTAWRWWLWPSPRFYAGLAGIWLALLLMHFVSPEPTPAGGSAAAGSPDRDEAPAAVWAALVEQRRWLAELLDGQSPPPPPKLSVPRSRSEHPTQLRSV
jgi:hypothetical protein